MGCRSEYLDSHKDIDWQALRELRSLYNESSDRLNRDYWAKPRLLASYDATLGQRIAWKWQAVLRELTARLSFTQPYRLMDWGCGSGVAARCWLDYFPEPAAVSLYDRSLAAVNFAADSLQKKLSTASLHRDTRLPSQWSKRTVDVLLVSHVLTELSDAAWQQLQHDLLEIPCLVWVDAGTHATSHRLIGLRQHLKSAGYQIIAPCQHQQVCGLQGKASSSPDWCHFFAEVPQDAFTSSFWRLTSQQLGIDLRSLPLSYLVAYRPEAAEFLCVEPTQQPGWRVVGRVRPFKGYCQAQICKPNELVTQRLQKRHHKADYKALSTTEFRLFWP